MHSVIATFASALLLVANVDATFQRCQADFYCTGGSLFNSPHNSYGADGNIYQRGQCIEVRMKERNVFFYKRLILFF